MRSDMTLIKESVRTWVHNEIRHDFNKGISQNMGAQ